MNAKSILLISVVCLFFSCKKDNETTPQNNTQVIELMGNSYKPIKYQEKVINSPIVYFNTNVLYVYRNDSLIIGAEKTKIFPIGISEDGISKKGYSNISKVNYNYKDFTSYEYLANDTLLLNTNTYIGGTIDNNYKAKIWLVKI